MAGVEGAATPDTLMPSAEQVRESVNLLLPEGEVVGLVSRRPCYASDIWIFDTSVGRVVAKVRRFAEEDPSQIDGQRRAQSLLSAAGFATPRMIALEASCALLGGRQVSILRFVDGIPGDQAIDTMHGAERDRLFEDLGRWTGVLHQLDIPSFEGWVDDDGGVHHSWGKVLAAIVDRALRDLDSYSAPLPRQYQLELERRLDAFVDSFTEHTPRLVHRDLHLGNVMVADGVLSSFLDFEMVREWDAPWEFPKLNEFVFAKYERSEHPFMEAYLASIEGSRADLPARVWLYEGLRYLTCMVDHLEGNPIYAKANSKFEG